MRVTNNADTDKIFIVNPYVFHVVVSICIYVCCDYLPENSQQQENKT